MSHLNDAPFYTTFHARKDEQKDFLNFLKGELGFGWKFSSPTERPAVVDEHMQFYVYFSGEEGDNETDLTKPVMGWTLDYNEHLNDLYHYIDNRRELVYKLREFYGEAIQIPKNLRILLSDEQISLLTDMLKSFRKSDKEFEADMLEDILSKGFYRVEYQKTLNNYINMYNYNINMEHSSEVLSMLNELRSNAKSQQEINKLEDQIEHTRKQIADLMAIRPGHMVSDLISNVKVSKTEKIKYWDEFTGDLDHYKVGVDAACSDSLTNVSTVGHVRKKDLEWGKPVWKDVLKDDKIYTAKATKSTKWKWPDDNSLWKDVFK